MAHIRPAIGRMCSKTRGKQDRRRALRWLLTGIVVIVFAFSHMHVNQRKLRALAVWFYGHHVLIAFGSHLQGDLGGVVVRFAATHRAIYAAPASKFNVLTAALAFQDRMTGA